MEIVEVSIYNENSLPVAISDIRTVVRAFLDKHGGMRNGYGTTMNGSVEVERDYSELTWSTPKIGKLTIDKVKDLTYKFKYDLYPVMKKFGISIIRFESRHVEDGCYYIHYEICHKSRL